MKWKLLVSSRERWNSSKSSLRVEVKVEQKTFHINVLNQLVSKTDLYGTSCTGLECQDTKIWRWRTSPTCTRSTPEIMTVWTVQLGPRTRANLWVIFEVKQKNEIPEYFNFVSLTFLMNYKKIILICTFCRTNTNSDPCSLRQITWSRAIRKLLNSAIAVCFP